MSVAPVSVAEAVAELSELLLLPPPLELDDELLPDVWLLTAGAAVPPVWLVEPSCTASMAPLRSAPPPVVAELPEPACQGLGALPGKMLFNRARTSV